MAQKIQFIAAVVSRPELVILDEPFSGLDPVNLDLLQQAVLDLRNEGTTVLLSTHDMDVAEQMCDRIFMIYKGNKVLDGTHGPNPGPVWRAGAASSFGWQCLARSIAAPRSRIDDR